MMVHQHPDIFTFMKKIIEDHTLARAKVAKCEANIKPKADRKIEQKKNAAIRKAVMDYYRRVNREDDDLFTEDEDEIESLSSETDEEDVDDEPLATPKYGTPSQRDAMERNPQWNLMYAIAHNTSFK